MKIKMIAAVDNRNGIGKDNELLYRTRVDMRHFERTTMGHLLIMGRKTYESLPKGGLKGRLCVVLTRNHFFKQLKDSYDLPVYTDVDALKRDLPMLAERAMDLDPHTFAPHGTDLDYNRKNTVFIIGGAQIYELFMPEATEIILTRYPKGDAEADTFFPYFDPTQWSGYGHPFAGYDPEEIRLEVYSRKESLCTSTKPL